MHYSMPRKERIFLKKLFYLAGGNASIVYDAMETLRNEWHPHPIPDELLILLIAERGGLPSTSLGTGKTYERQRNEIEARDRQDKQRKRFFCFFWSSPLARRKRQMA